MWNRPVTVQYAPDSGSDCMRSCLAMVHAAIRPQNTTGHAISLSIRGLIRHV
jgi:hypothetical protein